MESTQEMSHRAGEAKGQAQEKTSTIMDHASNTAQSAKESIQEVGAQASAKAQGVVEAAKNATGMNK